MRNLNGMDTRAFSTGWPKDPFQVTLKVRSTRVTSGTPVLDYQD